MSPAESEAMAGVARRQARHRKKTPNAENSLAKRKYFLAVGVWEHAQCLRCQSERSGRLHSRVMRLPVGIAPQRIFPAKFGRFALLRNKHDTQRLDVDVNVN